MRGFGDRILLLLVIGLTAFSVIVVWPSEPERYLPNFVPWPEGRGIKFTAPTIEGGTFGTGTIERRAMSLGLDLRGGTRLVLEPEGTVPPSVNLDEALDGARDIIERRVNEFGIAESEVNRLGSDRLAVQLPGIDPEDAIQKIGRTALLQFCEPITNGAGDVAAIPSGSSVLYQSQTCEPISVLDADGEVVATVVRDGAGDLTIESEGDAIRYAQWTRNVQTAGPDELVWQPSTGDLDGVDTALTGEFLQPTTSVSADPVLGTPLLIFEWNGDGAAISEQVTQRLVTRGYPLAPFIDGEPIRGDDGGIIAPTVNGVITNIGSIDGLSLREAQDLSRLLNTGAFPIPLRIVQQQDVDATLGETAVRNSVIAGEVALLLIMLFMVLYYRLPGLMASLALVVYTAFVLAIFKLWPVTLTLGGVAAFILSVGMAVDANILIFERMKEELRMGRNMLASLEDGFNRAWSSIRDSNISTLITCVILYWFGNQFDEAAIKGFAITLGIGVLVSMFSAITVSRTFMRLVVNIRPLTRRPWLFASDLPEHVRHEGQRVPAVAGGSNERPAERREQR